MAELPVCVDDIAFCVVVFIEVWKLLLVTIKCALANCSINVSFLGSSQCLGKDHVKG